VLSFDFNALINILEQLKAVFNDSLSLSYEKQEVIVKNRTERLNEIVQREIANLSRINEIEGRRLKAVAALSPRLGLEPKEINFSHLAALAEGREKERLLLLQKELTAIFSAQAQLNKSNKKLIETHLEYLETMLNVLLGPADPLNNFYGEDGVAEKRNRAGLFDQQI
jgi:flagellar biosynthesis/type III secretory pathway chaperone